MIVSAAQIGVQRDDVDANLQTHLRFIDLAAANGVQLLVFPELSLTGYEIEKAATLAFSPKDERLAVLQEKAITNNMVVVAGAPIQIETALYIGAFILLPDGLVEIYTKQHLHGGEEAAFSASTLYNPLVKWGTETMTFAICADITHPSHPANARQQKSTLYAAGICYTPNGIDEAHLQLSSYARQYSLQVVMANFVGPVYRYKTAGRSAIWDATGRLLACADGETEGLLRVDTEDPAPQHLNMVIRL